MTTHGETSSVSHSYRADTCCGLTFAAELDEHLTQEERAQLHGKADPKKLKEIHEAALKRKAAAGKP